MAKIDDNFLTWTLESSGASGSVVFDPVLQKTVFKCVGNGTANSYARLVKNLSTPKSFLLIRLIVEMQDDHSHEVTTLRHLVLRNSSGSIIGGYGHATNGVTVVTINTVNPSSSGIVKEPGNILEAWLFFKRDATAGYVGAAGNIGANSISRVNYNAGANDFAKIEVGCIPLSGGTFTGTVNIIACDVYDSTPEDVSLIYPTANKIFYKDIPSIIELTAPNNDPLTSLTINGNEVFFSDINGTRANTKASSGILIDSTVFTADSQYEGALVKFTAAPFEHDLPAQVLWTQGSINGAYLNRFAAALYVENNSYTSGSQTTINQTYTLTRCISLPNGRRWLGLPGISTTGQVEITAQFGTERIIRIITVSPSAPPATKVSSKGLSMAVGCDDGLLDQTSLHRRCPQLPYFYNSIMVGATGVYTYVGWAVAKLLDGLGFKAVSHLWNATNLNEMTAAQGAKILTLSRNILMQQGYVPWMFVAPNGQTTSSDAVNMLSTILGLFSLCRGSTSSYYTLYPQTLTSAINSFSIRNNTGTGTTYEDKAADILSTSKALSGNPTDAVVSMNVHAVGESESETSHSLINALIAEAQSQGILVSSLFEQFMPPKPRYEVGI